MSSVRGGPAGFPADREITRSAVLPVPVLTVETGGTRRSASENRDLAAALATRARTRDTEDVSALVRFLDRYPRSRWRPALLSNFGLHWRRTGRFQKGIDAFEEAWSLARRGKGVHAETVASWAAGELAHIGHHERVASLLRETRGRQILGAATEHLTAAKEALLRSQQEPENEDRCGPMAVASLLLVSVRSVSSVASGSGEGGTAAAAASPPGRSRP